MTDNTWEETTSELPIADDRIGDLKELIRKEIEAAEQRENKRCTRLYTGFRTELDELIGEVKPANYQAIQALSRKMYKDLELAARSLPAND